MILSREHILCYFIFILCISLITFYYIKKNKNISLENFKDDTNNDELKSFNDTEISKPSVKNAINDKIKSFTSAFDKYSVLDPAITANNNGVICDRWDGYGGENTDTNPFNSSLNSCKLVNNSNTTVPQCLTNNILISCDMFFNDGIINDLTSIDIISLKKNIRDNIIRNCQQLISSLDKSSVEIDLIIESLLDKLKVEEQQLYFIKYNISNLDDKTKLVNKTTEEYIKNENDINVNQVNFTNFLSKNNTNTNKINFYYKIIIGLIITLIVIGIFNIFLSNF